MLNRKPSSSLRLTLTVLGALSFCSGASADTTSPPAGGEGYAPPIHGTKDDKDGAKYGFDKAERAMAAFKYPKDLQMSLWASEPMLCNVNAIAMDEKGNIFVAETNRYHGGVIDIRGAMTWLDEDIASKSVADRIKMIKNHASEGPGKEALQSPESERIVELQDTTGSGKADKATVFADGFDKPEDGLGSGILARHGSVFYTCIPSLYELRDTKGVGRADVKKVLSTGYGIRYAFLGHDLHGLVFGPDGKLYYSIGDRAANVDEPADNRHVENLESGAVFRCNPDGTDLEIFAVGLRNPQELRFDKYGNLFTGDNNPDKGDPARWVNVIEDGDSGWREGYQYAEQMQNGGPWMAEQIWSDEEHNNAHYINPCVQALGAGPSGLVYYPGTGLPERYNDHFFLCDFRGGKQNSGIWSIRNVRNGASFKIVGDDGQPVPHNGLDKENIVFHLLGTDCEYGVDGGLYISDWLDGWGRPNAGRIYHLFDEKLRNDSVVLETKKLLSEGMEHRSPEELIKLLGHADMRVRQEAQFALAEKGTASAPALTDVAVKGETTLPRLHAIWGLGQIAAKSKNNVVLAPLTALLADKDLEVRCQAAKGLGDGKVAAAEGALLQLLKDSEARVRYFAAMALGKIGDKAAEGPIVEAIKENADKDATLRFGCVDALAKLADESALVAEAKDASPSVRLAAALALRRLKSPKVAAFLNDSDRSIVLEAARAINDFPITEALPELAALLDEKPVGEGKRGFTEKDFASDGPKGTGNPSDWVQWRAVNANYRLGTPEAARRLAAFAAREDAPEAVRVEALHDLGAWEQPPGRDRISDQWRPLPARDVAVAKAAAKDVVEQIAKSAPDKVRIAATKLMSELGLGNTGDLLAMVKNTKLDPKVRATALASLASTKGDKELPAAIDFAIKDESPEVRTQAIIAAGALPDAIKRLKSVLDTGSTSDKQAAIDALGAAKDKKHGPEAVKILSEWMDKLLAREVAPELQLNLLEAAGEHKDKTLGAKIKQFDASRDPKDTLSPWRECTAGGDVEAGRKIFRERADVSCIRCHTAEVPGGVVGPRLDGVGAKQTREYLLESIVLPNAKIAPGFETVVIQTKEGKFRTGVLRHEDDKTVELLNIDLEPEKQHIVVDKSDIKSRDRGPSAMPEGLIKTLSKRDLRNLVEFLASLKADPKDATMKHGA